MIVKMFVQDSCPNCPNTKALGKELINQGLNVEFFDVKTPEGLAESLMFDVLTTPSTIVLKKEKVVDKFLGNTPEIGDVKKWC